MDNNNKNLLETRESFKKGEDSMTKCNNKEDVEVEDQVVGSGSGSKNIVIDYEVNSEGKKDIQSTNNSSMVTQKDDLEEKYGESGEEKKMEDTPTHKYSLVFFRRKTKHERNRRGRESSNTYRKHSRSRDL